MESDAGVEMMIDAITKYNVILEVALKPVLFVHIRRSTMLHCLQEIRPKTKIDVYFIIYLFRIVGSPCDGHRHFVVSTATVTILRVHFN